MLHAHAIRYLAVDTDPGLVNRLRGEGRDIYWGNASRPEFLARCGLAKARALVITMDKPADAEDIARARDAHHATQLYGLGVSDAVPETIEASLQLSEAVLVDMGVPMGKVIASIHEKRDEFRKFLQPIAGRAEARRAIKMSLRMKEMNKRQPKSKLEE
jgi:monovalent cation:H+ antiporter-2, CPA2 family